MAYVRPVGIIDASWSGAGAYQKPLFRLVGDWSGQQRLAPAGIVAGSYGQAFVTKQQFIWPAWANSTDFGRSNSLQEGDYLKPQFRLDATWHGASPYSPPAGVTSASWSTSVIIVAPTSIQPALAVGVPVMMWTQKAEPLGIAPEPISADLDVLHDYQYSIPKWLLNASWVGALPYSGLSGVIDAQWQKNRPVNDVAPLGFAGLSVGVPTLSVMRGYVEPQGTNMLTAGQPVLTNAASNLRPAGIAPRLGFGAAKIELFRRYISVSGFKRDSYGTASLMLWLSQLKPTGFAATRWGTATLSGGVRNIQLGSGIAAASYGTARLSFRVREIRAEGFDTRRAGIPMMGYQRGIQPAGDDLSRFGVAHAWDNTQTLYAQGFNGASFGTAYIDRHTRSVGVKPMTPDLLGGFGVHGIQNIVRILRVGSNDSDWGPFFGNFAPFVANRNRTITTYGVQSSRFGLGVIENGGRPLLAKGGDLSLHGTAMVAYRIRYLPLGGFDALSVTNWASVVNGARVLAPASIQPLSMSSGAKVVNTRRHIAWFDAQEHTEYGHATVSFGRRELIQFHPSGQPYIPMPKVFLGQQYLFPEGFTRGAHGMAFVYEHFTTFAPRWVHVDKLGTPTVLSRNRTLGHMGRPSDEYGTPALSLYDSYLDVTDSPDFGAVGKPHIADRRRTITQAGGTQMLRMSHGHRVQLYEPDRPYNRTIEPAGAAPPPTTFGRPDLRSNSIYPVGIEPNTRYGRPEVVSFGIMPKGYTLDYTQKFGIPFIVYPRGVSVFGIEPPDIPKEHNLSPNTIWATTDPPPNAARNNGGRGFNPIDSMEFGRPVLRMTGTQWLYPRHGAIPEHARYGTQSIENKLHFIEPRGLNSFRYGWPRIPTTIYSEPVGFDDLQLGRPRIERVVPIQWVREIQSRGLSAAEYGRSVVELQHRTIYPVGYNAMRSDRQLRVGPPLRVYPAGFDAQVIGSGSWASLKIRRLHLEGWESFSSEYAIGEFSKRMRVSVRVEKPPYQLLGPQGVNAGAFGQQSVHNHARVIQPLNCCNRDAIGRPVVELAAGT